MATPPEPLDELLDEIALAVIGRVVRAERVEVDEGRRAIGAATARPAQAVEIQVEEVLMGEAAERVALTKPTSAYVLVEGATGVFVADRSGVLIGNQGPDTWPVEQVRATLAPKTEAEG